MSNPNPVQNLLVKLSLSHETVTEAYYHSRVHKTEDNARDIESLRQLRLISPDIRDAFQLRASFRHFLNAALNNERLFSTGANIGAYFERLEKLIEGHSIAYQDGRDADCELYEVETREAINDIADVIESDLIMLQTQVATRFAAVTTIAEKKQQNIHYQKRTQKLVDLLENFHFADIGEQLAGHDELALSFKSLLADRIPTFREALWAILDTLNQYLFEFRKIEERAKHVRAFALHLNRNPNWTPKEWDEAANPEDWLCAATPLQIQTHPDVYTLESEEFFAEIARTIPNTASPTITKNKTSRPAGSVEGGPGNQDLQAPESPIRKAIRLYFKEAKDDETGISARAWWARNPEIFSGIKENIWLLRVHAELDNKGKVGKWSYRVQSRQHPKFNGNVLIEDIVISKKAA